MQEVRDCVSGKIKRFSDTSFVCHERNNVYLLIHNVKRDRVLLLMREIMSESGEGDQPKFTKAPQYQVRGSSTP